MYLYIVKVILRLLSFITDGNLIYPWWFFLTIQTIKSRLACVNRSGWNNQLNHFFFSFHLKSTSFEKICRLFLSGMRGHSVYPLEQNRWDIDFWLNPFDKLKEFSTISSSGTKYLHSQRELSMPYSFDKTSNTMCI